MNMSSASLSASESTGFFGAYGGQFVPDDLKARLDEVTEAFDRYRDNSFFILAMRPGSHPAAAAASSTVALDVANSRYPSRTPKASSCLFTSSIRIVSSFS